MGDELARQRRELPWVPVEEGVQLQTKDGDRTLAELFDGRSQLMVYHFMFGPDWQTGCPTCSSTADSFDGVLAHLAARDVTMICISRAPVAKLLAYQKRMGWSFTWASSDESDFNVDFGVSAGTGLAHDPAPPRPEANELALLKLLIDHRPSGRICRRSPSRTRAPAERMSTIICPRATGSARSRAKTAPSITATPATPGARSS